ncbi:glucuronate isomerase [Halanaerobium saccharolyticum]|uniref:glucuronate isomerase n=1 Tax=Halanaerobium saccharolyticum TaxID=43595 RepID=UPI003FCE7DF0
MAFQDENYLLRTETAKKLYKEVEELPIIDAHNHGDIKEIIDNQGWNDIWEVEAETDHYVWELMRRCGVEEEKITGEANNKEKWLALAEVFPEFIGNPTYDWIHLDLKRRFGIEKLISKETAAEIWDQSKEILKQEKMKPQQLLKEMKVEIMCTSDDPRSELEYHKRAAEELDQIKILPTWRPDPAFKVAQNVNWNNFVDDITEMYSEESNTLDGFLAALKGSHDYFAEQGCLSTDHDLVSPYTKKVAKKRAEEIYNKAREKEKLNQAEVLDFQAFLMEYFVDLNKEKDWVMHLHIGAVRNYSDKLEEELGADAGGDICRQDLNIVDNLRYLFNLMDGELDSVLYCMDPVYLTTMASIVRAFPNLYMGAAWWLSDTAAGIRENLEYTANVDLLTKHAGMVSDSRKVMSYDSRNEIFRRVLADYVGELVEVGQVPEELAVELVKDLSYRRPKKMFF